MYCFRIAKILLVIYFSALTVSCVQKPTPIPVGVNTSRIESPEIASTPYQSHFGVGLHEQSILHITEDVTALPPILDNPSLRANNYFKPIFHLAIPVRSGIEVLLDNNSGVQVRSQVLGNRLNSSAVSDISAAVSLGVNYMRDEIDETEDRNNYNHFYAYDWTQFSYNANIVFGKRIYENLLVYGGPFYTTYDLQGELNQRYSLNYSDNTTTDHYVFDGKGYQAGFGFAVELTFSGDIMDQAIVYNFYASEVGWNNYTSEARIKHGVHFKYYF